MARSCETPTYEAARTKGRQGNSTHNAARNGHGIHDSTPDVHSYPILPTWCAESWQEPQLRLYYDGGQARREDANDESRRAGEGERDGMGMGMAGLLCCGVVLMWQRMGDGKGGSDSKEPPVPSASVKHERTEQDG